MQEIMIIEIAGKPIAKKRPRFFRRGKGVGTYSDQVTEEGKYMLMLKAEVQKLEGFPKHNPIFLYMDFFMPVPSGWPKYKKRELSSNRVFWHIKKPDLDNLIKWVCDCSQNILFDDDKIVCGIKASKQYSLYPRTKIQVIDV